ncbi:hypothetical protein [Acinetobacter radioresistens]|uniref:hypothetical protein n=1 Tax=Acinetobacter radioresistens TaxID=40216 RepID=UPI00200562DB|nr:hypothetical protein [Acinetobacter radioresistens]MCK4101106.1 hypothetical protein [Acinetobacter radioresistens]
MIGHERKILATLGIDVWIPRGTVSARLGNTPIWRDQTAKVEPLHFHDHVKNVKPDSATENLQKKITDIVEQVAVDTLPPQAEKEHLPAASKDANAAEAVNPIVEVEAFSVQAYSLVHCIILINATRLTEPQQQLWLNIQRSLSGQYSLLEWPFPLPNFQDNRGVGCYVQGFIDAIAYEKSILSLGDIPYLNHSKIIRLASLQEMLDKPLLKKRLWQFMYKKME